MANKQTYLEVLKRASCFLEEKGIASQEADLLAKAWLKYLKGWDQTQLLLSLSQEGQLDQEAWHEGLNKLGQGWPLQYVTGQEEFFGRDFLVNPSVLIPRPETEELVERVLSELRDQSGKTVIELGVGSGCIILSLALEAPQHTYLGTDISPEALATARANEDRLGAHNIQWVLADLWQGVDGGPYDILVSNPPYIGEEEIDLMDASVVAYEPHLALFAPNKGLALYEAIAQDLEVHLLPQGQAFFEIGFAQGPALEAIFRKYCPARPVFIHKDLAGQDRILQLGPQE